MEEELAFRTTHYTRDVGKINRFGYPETAAISTGAIHASSERRQSS